MKLIAHRHACRRAQPDGSVTPSVISSGMPPTRVVIEPTCRGPSPRQSSSQHTSSQRENWQTTSAAAKTPFAEWISDHAGPGHAIGNPHRDGIFHVLFAIGAVADQHKLHVAILLVYQARSFEKIADAFLGK